MTNDSITYYLENLSRLNSLALEDLDRMILDSPYCANLRFLKAKKLQLSGQTEDMEPFYKAAMYSFDKHRLYDRLINSEVERELFRLEYLKSQQEKQERKRKKKSKREKIKKYLKKEIKLAKENPESEIQDEQLEIQLEEKLIEQTDNADVSTIEESKAVELIEKTEEKEKQEEKKSKSKKAKENLKKKKKAKSKSSKKDKKTKKKTKDQKEKKLKVSKSKERKKPKKKLKKKLEEQTMKQILESDHLSEYTKWLLQLSASKKAEKQLKKDQKKKKSSSKKKSSKKKKTTYNYDQSNQLQEGIISENFAFILAKQGHIEKSIEMYEKLSLINPQKSSFFAAQIKKLKKNLS